LTRKWIYHFLFFIALLAKMSSSIKRLWTRMLDLLCTILIFKNHHAVISWWFSYAYWWSSRIFFQTTLILFDELFSLFPFKMFSYFNTVKYILQCEIRLIHCIFINWKDFSFFLCQLQHMHGGVLTQSKCYCNVFT
jgi:hypothetical protein